MNEVNFENTFKTRKKIRDIVRIRVEKNFLARGEIARYKTRTIKNSDKRRLILISKQQVILKCESINLHVLILLLILFILLKLFIYDWF